MTRSKIYPMRRLGFLILIALALYTCQHRAQAGTIQCSATCLSKLASGVSIAANAKTIAAGWRKLRHPKGKKPVQNPNPKLNPPGAVVDQQGFPVSWPTPECVGSACVKETK